jgi:hypothetical protein
VGYTKQIPGIDSTGNGISKSTADTLYYPLSNPAGYVTGTPWTGMGYLTAESDTLQSVMTRNASTATQLTSTLAIGTSPFAVTSTTVNTNLNADMVDGKNVGTSLNTIPLLDGNNTWSGYDIFNGFIGYNVTPTSPVHLKLAATDLYGVNIDGITTPLTTSAAYTGFNNTRRINTAADVNGNVNIALNNTINDYHIISGTNFFGAAPYNYGAYNVVNNYAAHTYTSMMGLSETNYGMYNSVYRQNTVTSSSWQPIHYGAYNFVFDNSNFNSAGANITSTAYGSYNLVLLGMTSLTAGSYTRLAYGSYSIVNGDNKGTSTLYANYAKIGATGTTNWIFYADGTIGNNFFGKNNVKSIFGTTNQGAIYHDGTNFIFNPKLVGSGYLSVLGGLASSLGFGCNGATPQTAYASGGAVATTGSALVSYGYTTSAQADGIVTLLNNIRTALVNAGLMT